MNTYIHGFEISCEFRTLKKPVYVELAGNYLGAPDWINYVSCDRSAVSLANAIFEKALRASKCKRELIIPFHMFLATKDAAPMQNARPYQFKIDLSEHVNGEPCFCLVWDPYDVVQNATMRTMFECLREACRVYNKRVREQANMMNAA